LESMCIYFGIHTMKMENSCNHSHIETFVTTDFRLSCLLLEEREVLVQ